MLQSSGAEAVSHLWPTVSAGDRGQSNLACEVVVYPLDAPTPSGNLAGEVWLPVAVSKLGQQVALLPGHSPVSLRPAFGLIAILIGIPLFGAAVTILLTTVGRSTLNRRRAERVDLSDATTIETRLRAAMSELCPHGWRAHVTLFGPDDELPGDAPAGARSRVALDWAELAEDGDREAIVRRVWAPTVAEALEAMVSDRRTDETLEQIERAAVWPD